MNYITISQNDYLILGLSGALDVGVGTPSNLWCLDVGQAYSLLWRRSSLWLTSDDYGVPRENLHKMKQQHCQRQNGNIYDSWLLGTHKFKHQHSETKWAHLQ